MTYHHASMLKVSLSLALMLWVGGDALRGQAPGGEWVQPYRSVPGVWELVGRLFPDTPEARRDRRFRGFLDPSVLAAGSIREATKTGEILGTFVRFLPVQNNNVLNTGEPPDRLVVAQVVQVLFVAIDGRSVRLETRDGDPSSEFQRCYDARHTQFAHLPDVRVQAAVLCEGAIFWTAWRGQPSIALDAEGAGTLLLDQLGLLSITLHSRTTQLAASIQAPPVGGGAGPRPR